MIIGDIKLSYPSVRYNVEVTHFTSRKSTAMEWVILEAVSRVSAMPQYSGMSADSLFQQIFTISDSDLLIKPCLIQLQDIGALITYGLSDDTSLKEIPMKNITLTETGKVMQKQGLLPGEDRTDYLRLQYHLMDHKIVEDNGGKYQDEPGGIAILDVDVAEEVAFPAAEVTKLLYEAVSSKSKKYPWLQPTTNIKEVQSVQKDMLWKTVTKKIELGENGMCWIKDAENEGLNYFIFEEGIFGETQVDASYGKLQIEDPDSQIREMFFLDEFPNRFDQLIQKDKQMAVSQQVWTEKYDKLLANKKSSIILIQGADSFSMEFVGKSVKVSVEDNLLPINGLYLGTSESVFGGNLTIHNMYGSKELTIGYRPNKSESDWNTILTEVVKRYVTRDHRMVILLHLAGRQAEFQSMIHRVLALRETMEEKLEYLEELGELCSRMGGNKPDLAAISQEIFDAELEPLETIEGVEAIRGFITQMGEIPGFRNNDTLFTNGLKKIFEKAFGIQSIKEIWGLWEELGQKKKSYLSWISKNGSFRTLYTSEVVKTLLKQFGNETVFEMEEYTGIERNFVELNRIALQMAQLLPEISIYAKYSEETIWDNVNERKENLVPISHCVKRWRDQMEEFTKRVGELAEYETGNSVFEICHTNMTYIMDAIAVFFDDATLKYKKVCVADTSSLMKEPELFTLFEDGRTMLIIPTIVLGELDKHKSSEDPEKSYMARQVIRQIDNYRAYDWLNLGEESNQNLLSKDLSEASNDNLILSVALRHYVKQPILISDDINFRNIAQSQGIEAMDPAGFRAYREQERQTQNNGKQKKNKKNRR